MLCHIFSNGRTMKSSQQTASFRTIAQGELRSQGFDSIEFNPGDGQEVVIFNSNRVPQSNSLCVEVCQHVMWWCSSLRFVMWWYLIIWCLVLSFGVQLRWKAWKRSPTTMHGDLSTTWDDHRIGSPKVALCNRDADEIFSLSRTLALGLF